MKEKTIQRHPETPSGGPASAGISRLKPGLRTLLFIWALPLPTLRGHFYF